MVLKDVRTVTSECGGFVAATLVHTEDGLRPIETVRVGDLVLARSEDGGDATFKRVIQTFEFEAKVIHAVFYVTGEDMDVVDTVFATGDHAFWVESEGWTRADELYCDGMQVRLADNRLAIVASRRLVYGSDTPDVGWVMNLGLGNHDSDTGQFVDFRGGVPEVLWDDKPSPNNLSYVPSGEDGAMLRKVYNFEVEDFHSYQVGTLGVWVRDGHGQNIP